MEGYKYFVGAPDGDDDDDEDGYLTPDDKDGDKAANAEDWLEDPPEAGPALSAKEPAGEVAVALESDKQGEALQKLGDALEAEKAAELAYESEGADAAPVGSVTEPLG